MFEMFTTCKHLGISTMAVYKGLVDVPCDETQKEPPYTKPTLFSYPRSISFYQKHKQIIAPFSLHRHTAHQNPPMVLTLTHHYVWTSQMILFILLLELVSTTKKSVICENEDDILIQHVINDNENKDFHFFYPPSHFCNVTFRDMEYIGDESVLSMSPHKTTQNFLNLVTNRFMNLHVLHIIIQIRANLEYWLCWLNSNIVATNQFTCFEFFRTMWLKWHQLFPMICLPPYIFPNC